MVAGLFGPADPQRLVALPVSPEAEPGDDDAASCIDDDLGPDEDEEEHHPVPSGISMGSGLAYDALFGEKPVQDAVKDMFCQADKLGGLFTGENQGDTLTKTAREVTEMVEAARNLGRCSQVLLGPVHTSKLHRLMRHQRSELELRGNLWEGDTSQNESLHKVWKRMYQRSN